MRLDATRCPGGWTSKYSAVVTSPPTRTRPEPRASAHPAADGGDSRSGICQGSQRVFCSRARRQRSSGISSSTIAQASTHLKEALMVTGRPARGCDSVVCPSWRNIIAQPHIEHHHASQRPRRNRPRISGTAGGASQPIWRTGWDCRRLLPASRHAGGGRHQQT